MTSTTPTRTPSETRPENEQQRLELDSVIAAVAAGLVVFVIAVFPLWGEHRPISGERSVASVASFLAGAAAAVSFLVAFSRSPRSGPKLERRLARVTKGAATVSVMLVCFGLAYITTLALAEIFQDGFIGLELDTFGGALAAGLAAAGAAYVVHPLGHDVSTHTLGILVPAHLAIGVVFSMLTASDPAWWELHFSELGAGGGISGFAFNATLILSGLLVVVLGGYVRGDLESVTPDRTSSRVKWVGRLLAVIGALMMMVGIVSVDVAEIPHIIFASGMVVVFGALCIALPFVAPQLPKAIHVTSAIMVVGIIVALVLWKPVGYYNFTAFEFAACGLIFVWLSVFIRSIDAATKDRHVAASAAARDAERAATDSTAGENESTVEA